MLSRILHRNKTAPAPSSPEEKLKAIAATLKSRVEPRSTVSTRDVDFFRSDSPDFRCTRGRKIRDGPPS